MKRTITVYVLYQDAEEYHSRPLDVTTSLEKATEWEASEWGHEFDTFEVEITTVKITK
jgi:hypothetical protein